MHTSEITLTYKFKDMTAGSADGIISFDFGNNADKIENITLFWATGNAKEGFSHLDGYTPLCSGDVATFENGYTIDKWLVIPPCVTALVAEISYGETTSKVVFELPEEKLTPVRTPLYTAAFCSDLHLGGWGSKETAKPGLVAARKDMNEFADFMVASGDVVQWHASYSDAEFHKYNFDGKQYKDNGLRDPSFLRTGINQWQVLEDYLKGFEIPVYILAGGHDTIDTDIWSPMNVSNDYFGNFLKEWIKYSESTESGAKYDKPIERDESVFYYDTEIYGHHYIFLTIPNIEKPYTAFGKKQLEWLDKKLFEKEETGKPIFVFGHNPVCNEPGTVMGTSNTDDAEAFWAILAKHPTAVYSSGHLHYTLDINKRTAIDGAQEKPSYIHNSGMTTTIYPPKHVQIDITHSVFVEVYEDCAVLRGRNNTTGKWISLGMTGLTFKKTCPIGEISALKTACDNNGKLTLTSKCSTDGVKFVWYLEDTVYESESVDVDSSYAGFVALRAIDSKGNYRSELYENLDVIPKAD